MDLTKLTDEQLAAECERRKIEKAAAEQNRRNFLGKFVLANIDAFLTMHPQHDHTSCSDIDNAFKAGAEVDCHRCFLLRVKRDKRWPDVHVKLALTRWPGVDVKA